MKFELRKLTNYSEQNLIDEIKRVAKLVGNETLSVKRFDNFSKVHSSTIRKRFGSWKTALEKANCGDKIDTSNVEVSKEELLKDMMNIYSSIGKSFTRKEFEQRTKYSATLIYKYFNKFSSALEEAGITPLKKSMKYNDDDRFENLLTVWTFYGRQPNYSEMQKDPSVIGPKSYVSAWGNWTNALQAFVEKVNSNKVDGSESSNEYAYKKDMGNNEFKKRIPKTDRREIPIGLRFDVLKRDNYKCVICGRNPATNMNCHLQVDHILAWSKGGKTLKENLQTLCSICNIGKSNK